jgi:hypothetical protein
MFSVYLLVGVSNNMIGDTPAEVCLRVAAAYFHPRVDNFTAYRAAGGEFIHNLIYVPVEVGY